MPLISVRGGKPWALPKGLVEEGEGTIEAAEREVREETGLSVRALTEIGSVGYYHKYRQGRNEEKVYKTVYFYLMEFLGGDTSLHDDEVRECRWFAMDEAIGRMTFEDERELLIKASELIDNM